MVGPIPPCGSSHARVPPKGRICLTQYPFRRIPMFLWPSLPLTVQKAGCWLAWMRHAPWLECRFRSPTPIPSLFRTPTSCPLRPSCAQTPCLLVTTMKFVYRCAKCYIPITKVSFLKACIYILGLSLCLTKSKMADINYHNAVLYFFLLIKNER